MNHRQTRFERSAEGSFPYWVCLIEEKCTGPNYEKVQEFCRANGLTLSRNGHSVIWQKEWYRVCRFAEACRSKATNECIRLKEARGKNWAQWKKGSVYAESSKPPTTSDTKL